MSWLFGPGLRSPVPLLERDGYALHLRFERPDDPGALVVGTRVLKGPTEWVPLDECTMTERGLWTPYVDEARNQRTTIIVPTAKAAEPRSAKASPSPEAEEPVPPPSDPMVTVAPGQAMPLGDFRRLVALIGRHYALADDLVRAGYCASVLRSLNVSPLVPLRLPEWLQRDLHRNGATNPDSRQPTTDPVISPPESIVEVDPDETWGALLVDPGAELDSVPLSQELVPALKGLGWQVGRSQLSERWTKIATMHRSYQYEHGLSKTFAVELLHALEDVGNNWVRLLVLDRYTAEYQPAKVGVQSTENVVFARTVRERIADWPVIADAVLLGKGEAAQSAGRRSRHQEVIAHQLIGAIALQGGYETVRKIVNRAFGQAPITVGAAIFDWRTLLQEQVREALSWAVDTSGPDHAKTYTAVVRDVKGRIGRGSGSTKKEAQRHASENYLRRHLPHAVTAQARSESVKTRRPADPSRYTFPSDALSKAVAAARDLFDLPRSADPLLMQAMTHRSWAHENAAQLKAARQRDNTFLAHHGSLVAEMLMAHERVRGILSRTLHPGLDEAIIMTPPETIWRDLFEKLPLRDGVLLSEGQSSDPPPPTRERCRRYSPSHGESTEHAYSPNDHPNWTSAYDPKRPRRTPPHGSSASAQHSPLKSPTTFTVRVSIHMRRTRPS
jgi:dsRNA-specific ribonuclease